MDCILKGAINITDNSLFVRDIMYSNNDNIKIITLDENFCQPYDYQYMLKNNPHFQFALQVKERVEQIMSYLQSVGVLSGHEYGDYI